MYHQTADGCPRNAGKAFSLGGIGRRAVKSATATADLEDCALICKVGLWKCLERIGARGGGGWSYDLAMMNLSQWVQYIVVLSLETKRFGAGWSLVCC